MNKKNICFYFQAHLPAYLKHYRFFDMGSNHDYFDTYAIRDTVQSLADNCFIPTNRTLLELINANKKEIKISLSITGELIEQLESYSPESLESFKRLAETGCVEFVCETYSHSLLFLKDEVEFKEQIKKHSALIKKHFNQTPKVIRLTGLIYSNLIGDMTAKMGYKTMLTENAKHIMGWRSSNYAYHASENKDLKLLLRNSTISDDITYNFSKSSSANWPITSEKVQGWIDAMDKDEQMVNIFLDYLTFGARHHRSSGIFDFLRYLPEHLHKSGKYTLSTLSESAKTHQAVDDLDVPYPISWYEEECDLSVWLGNDMQKDAFTSLCSMADKIRFIKNESIEKDWRKLQDSDNFYFMCTRKEMDRLGKRYKNSYESPFNAYINYMNVLSDMNMRINQEVTQKVETLMKTKTFADKAYKDMVLEGDTINYTNSQIETIIALANTMKK